MKLERRRRRKRKIKPKRKKPNIEFISTGILLLNLILSGKGRRGGFARGRIANIVGDGSTGKTLLCLEVAAWCFYNLKRVKSRIFGRVKNIYIVFNNVEGVMDFDLESMFGIKFARAVEWIRISKVEALGRDLTRRVKALKKGDFLLYITDSWDGVKSEEESERFDEEAKKDKVISDGYGMTKQQYTNRFFRNICDSIYGEDFTTSYDYKLDQKDVTILITSQIRQKIGATKFEKDTYRLGGKAFDFWTHQVIWLYKSGKLKEEIKGKSNIFGVKVRAVVERSKVNPPWKEIRFPIIWDHGIDNIGCMVDYMFGPQSKSYNFMGVKSARKEDFISKIMDADLEGELWKAATVQWNDSEKKSRDKHKRRPKYED